MVNLWVWSFSSNKAILDLVGDLGQSLEKSFIHVEFFLVGCGGDEVSVLIQVTLSKILGNLLVPEAAVEFEHVLIILFEVIFKLKIDQF